MALQQSIDDDSNQKILLQQITDYACGDSKLMINLINFIHPTWFLYGHGPLQSGSLIAKTTWDSPAKPREQMQQSFLQKRFFKCIMLPVVGERKRCEGMEEERANNSRTNHRKTYPSAEHHGHVLKHNKNGFLLIFNPFYLIGKGIWHVNG
jgi:hypothetical protein